MDLVQSYEQIANEGHDITAYRLFLEHARAIAIGIKVHAGFIP